MVTSSLKLITRHYHAIEMPFFIHEGRGYAILFRVGYVILGLTHDKIIIHPFACFRFFLQVDAKRERCS
jgi:hypothetical protein